ncbi:hypothetical protein [Corallococcus terminator]|uniref:Uncharacterized protein n=1 Tax=Corallococcus terminator TaxID=2316733 RepID=A0A3A8IY07_9BACT|nr:hypothetical protein [Corallococcus terminator]RKG88419.1 hypothetical protein D7V88_14375 [Corallococcus terminator]
MAEQGPPDPIRANPRPYYLSFLSTLSVSPYEFHKALIWLNNTIEPYSWKRLVACYALTDVPEQILELYRIPDSESLTTGLKALWTDRTYCALATCCRDREMDLTYGLPYDPGVGDAIEPSEEIQTYFLQECITVKAGQQDHFLEALPHVREAFQAKKWKLISASQSLTPPYRVMHFWRFEFADQLADLMKELPQDPRYAAFEDCCESQWQRLNHTLKALPLARSHPSEGPAQ